jgi:hypothetical protein
MQVAEILFWSSHRHLLAQVAFWAEVVPVMVQVPLCHCSSSVSEYFLWGHLGEEDSRPFDFCEPLLGVVRFQPAPCYVRETQHPASSLLRLQRKVS